MEKTYEKNAWIILYGLGLLALFLGFVAFVTYSTDALVTENLTGMTWEELQSNIPGIGDLVNILYRAMGLAVIVYSVLFLIIMHKGYRKGELWSWYSAWTMPIYLITTGIVNSLGSGEVSVWGILIFSWAGLAILGLVLPFRKFFPKK